MNKIVLFIALSFIGTLNATTYYVDNIAGNDDSSGMSPQAAWKTLTKSNSPQIPYSSGDTIAIKSGSRIENDSICPPHNYLTYTIYDGWEKATIFRNGTSEKDYCVNLEDNHDYNTHKDSIKFCNLHFAGGYKTNLCFYGCSHITIENCDIDSTVFIYTDTAGAGMIYVGKGHNWKIINCNISFSKSGHGIYIDGPDYMLIDSCNFIGNAKNGLNIAFGDDHDWTNHLTVKYCNIRRNIGVQIYDDGSRRSEYYYNVIENSTGWENRYSDCIQIVDQGYAPVNNQYYQNTLITHHRGIGIEIGSDARPGLDNSTNVDSMDFRNNIVFVDSGYISDDYGHGWGWFIRGDHGTHWTVNSNLYYAGVGNYSKFWQYKTITCSDFYNWKGVSSWDSAGVNNTPMFNNFDSGDYALKDNSSAVLAGVWVGLNAPNNHDIVGTPIGNPPDIGAYQKSTYWQGPISTDQTMSGSVAIVDSITVASGCTLTVSPGTHIKIENGSNLRVNGILHCNYDSEAGNIIIDTILADNKKGSIIFDGSTSSNSVLQYITMRHGGGIQCLNGANVLIKNSELDTCTQGIYIYNSGPQILNNNIIDPLQNAISGQAVTYMPKIKGNVLTKTNYNGWEGIYLINGINPIVENNDISGFDYGVYIGGGSTCIFYEFSGFNEISPIPNNRFQQNNIGLCSAWGSTIWAGGEDYMEVGNYNTIIDNNVCACFVYEESYVEAASNYWGPGDITEIYPFWVDDNSTFEWGENYLTIDPWNPLENSEDKQGDQITSNKHLNKSMSGNNISTGLLLEKNGNVDDAVNFYKGLIANNNLVRIALSQLARIKYQYSKSEIVTYFGNLLTNNNEHYAQVKKLLGDMSLQNNQFETAMSLFNDVINNYPTEYDGISARFEKLFAYLHIKKDPSTASQILADIKGINSKDIEVQMRIKIAENLLDGSNNVIRKSVASGNNIPKTYGLSQNYPNPFNPSTKINYQIPMPGMVTLKVYDILGREVATLVNENKIEGIYNFNFNASKFASGVYIYQLRVNDYIASKKMIMLK
jgi:parallel beta-helix repeat protein